MFVASLADVYLKPILNFWPTNKLNLNTQLFAFLEWDLPSFFKVVLIPNQVLDDVLVCQFLDLIEPIRNTLKRVPIRDIIDNEDPLCASVITADNGLEPILPCSIPLFLRVNLQFVALLICLRAKGTSISTFETKVHNPRRLLCSNSGGICSSCIALISMTSRLPSCRSRVFLLNSLYFYLIE